MEVQSNGNTRSVFVFVAKDGTQVEAADLEAIDGVRIADVVLH